MTFYMRNYTSDEKYDIAKFLDYSEGVFDVIASPFLARIAQLPTVKYYYVDKGYKEIDMIASSMYNDQFFAYLIQYYNNDFRETFPEGTVLKLFSADDLNALYTKLATSQNLENQGS